MATRTSMLEAKDAVLLEWLGLTYTVQTSRRREKSILHGVSGNAAPGQMLAVMGSSGSGKTTLLNLLSGRELGGTMGGSLRVNGAPMQRSAFRRSAGYVTQDSLLMETQTPREIFAFSAALRLPRSLSAARRRQLVQEVVEVLRLGRAADTIVGNPLRGGISGGERKRTKIGEELVTNPSTLFLDEPTSGLDAFTALKVVQTLKQLAKQNRTVVAVVHQPASEIFFAFDKLQLLHQGGCAYFGKVTDALHYFSALSHVCPHNHNPADFLVHILMEQAIKQPTVIK